MKRLPISFKKYFWDTDFNNMVVGKNKIYVIERLLEYGDVEAYRWLKKNFPKNLLVKIASRSRRIGAQTKNFWQVIS